MTPRTRLAALLGLATLLWWARERVGGDDLVARPASGAARSRVAAPPEDVCTTPAQVAQREPLREALQRDPFTGLAAGGGDGETRRAAKPAPPPPPVVAEAPPPPPPPPPAAPPPLRVPFRYIGQFSERDGRASAFLGLGTALVTARPGDNLDGGWRLDAIAPRELTFTHLATRTAVRLAVEGETP